MKRLAGTSSGAFAIGICVAAALASLWLRAGIPLLAIGGSSLDDALFLKLADSLLAGQWLGPYDNATLAKGMFYPLFIAGAAALHVPLKVAEQLVYLGVCGGTAAFVAHESRRVRPAVVLFVALAFNPLLWLPFMARVIREGLYVSLALLLVVLFTATLFATFKRSPARHRIVLAAMTGIAGGCFWLTREEGPWILPALAVLLLVRLLLEWKSPASGGAPLAARWARMAAACVVPALFASAVTLGVVRLANHQAYGVFETNEFHSRSFQRAYGALSRIRPQHWQRYVVIPKDAREKAYGASPAAAELRGFFEGDDGKRWQAIGCAQMGHFACTEIHSGWFMWALREAVAKAGHYRTAPEALGFYERLADEIDAACDAGKIDCRPARATMAPPFRWHYLVDAMVPAWDLTRFAFQMGGGVADISSPSSGTSAEIEHFRRMTGGEPTPPLEVAGWVAATSPIVEIALYDARGQRVEAQSVRRSAPDVEAVWPQLRATRFRMTSQCAPGDCLLRVRTAARTVDLPLRRLSLLDEPGTKVFVDTLSSGDAEGNAQALRLRTERLLLRAIGLAYAFTFPLLALAALAGLLAAAVQPATRREHAPWIALATASLVAVFSRVALLAYLDATSIPSANGSYFTPASAFVVVFVVLGLWLGRMALRHRRAMRGTPRG